MTNESQRLIAKIYSYSLHLSFFLNVFDISVEIVLTFVMQAFSLQLF